MKSFVTFTCAFAALAAAVTAQGQTSSSSSTSFVASASVGVACAVEAAQMNFGSVDQFEEFLAEATITVSCTEGVGYSVGLDAGLHFAGDSVFSNRRMSNGDGGFVSYRLLTGNFMNTEEEWGDGGVTYPFGQPVGGLSFGEPTNLTVYGIASSQFNGGDPFSGTGSFSDQVTVTVTF